MKGIVLLSLVLLPIGSPALGEVLEFTDKQQWMEAVGTFAVLRFTEFPPGTYLDDQYASLGILFPDDDDNSTPMACAAPNDLWGVDGNEAIHVSFTSPHYYLAADHPGWQRFFLYYQGELIYATTWPVFPGSGVGHFAGVVSTQPFDEAMIVDWLDDQVNVDDLYFGPAPATPDLEIEDCDNSGWVDQCDVIIGGAPDCNGNLIPDDCDIASSLSIDCNLNGIPDECDRDCNGNGLPDDCESPPFCAADVAEDDCEVNVNDLVEVILDWGCPGPCSGDSNDDGTVDVQDLINVILGWGACSDN